MILISDAFRLAVCSSSFLYMFYVVCNLVSFLSKQYDNNISLCHPESEGPTLLWILMIDTSLISIFILQHSIMATDFIKQLFINLKIQDLERSVYNACSAAALHFMIKMWCPASCMMLWNINTIQNTTTWLIITVFQVLGWIIVYSGCLMMDFGELVGIKQVVYKITGRPCPMSMKSKELRRYYSHMRHPSLIGFLIILWIHPFMSIDRVVLALFLTMYMVLTWNIDEQDYRYHAYIIQRKKNNLLNCS